MGRKRKKGEGAKDRRKRNVKKSNDDGKSDSKRKKKKTGKMCDGIDGTH